MQAAAAHTAGRPHPAAPGPRPARTACLIPDFPQPAQHGFSGWQTTARPVWTVQRIRTSSSGHEPPLRLLVTVPFPDLPPTRAGRTAMVVAIAMPRCFPRVATTCQNTPEAANCQTGPVLLRLPFNARCRHRAGIVVCSQVVTRLPVGVTARCRSPRRPGGHRHCRSAG